MSLRKKRFVLNYVSNGRKFPFTGLVCSLYLLDRFEASRWLYWILIVLTVAAILIVVFDYFMTKQIPIKIEDMLDLNTEQEEEDIIAKEEIRQLREETNKNKIR